MHTQQIKRLAMLILLFTSNALAAIAIPTNSIALNHPQIHVLGAAYIYPTAQKLSYSRFPESILAPSVVTTFNKNYARTTTGIRILFKTNSSQVSLTFKLDLGENRGSDFSVLQNGILDNTP
jgi:hypothetical protein